MASLVQSNSSSLAASQVERRILLVEDNPGDADLVEAILSPADDGYELVRARRLSEAVEQLTRRAFGAILLDLGLPDSQGLDTFRGVAQWARGTPIIVLSALNDLSVSAEAVRQGAQDCLNKDYVSGDMLNRAIRFAIERHRILSQMSWDSFRDKLTGLYNRRGFAHFATPLLDPRAGVQATLLSIDLDGLKPINDQLGHEAEIALVETAEVLHATFRESDVLARLGGDEFVALTVSLATCSASSLEQRILEEVAERNRRPGRDYQLSMSVGICGYQPARHATLADLLAEADQLMYEQKRRKPRPARS